MSRLKGRPEGSGNNKLLIDDQLISPYKVNYDLNNNSYNLLEEGKNSPIGYFNSLGGALRSVAQKLVAKKAFDADKTYTIKEYIQEQKEILNQLNNLA